MICLEFQTLISHQTPGCLLSGNVFCEMFHSNSLMGQHKQRTDSSFLIIRVLIWTPCSFKFICRATLLLLGPQNQTGALSGSVPHGTPPSQKIGHLALDWNNGVARQQAGLPLNKSLRVPALMSKMVWARWGGWSQNINHRIMLAMLMNQLFQINKLRSFWDAQHWFSHPHLLHIMMRQCPRELSQEDTGNCQQP